MDESEKHFWHRLDLWGNLFITVLSVGLVALLEGRWTPGGILTLAGSAGVIYVSQQEKSKQETIRYVAMAMLVLTWVFLGYDIYDRHFASDPRDMDSSRVNGFIDELKTVADPGLHFHLVCVNDESCTIAAKYRDRLSNAGWVMRPLENLHINAGLYVLTRSDYDHPPQVSTLRRVLEKADVNVEWWNDPNIAPGDFSLVIGPRK